MLEFLTTHWEIVASGLALLIAVLNAVSRHFSQHAGLARVILIAAELLSVFRSAGAPGSSLPGWLSRLKLPLQSVPPRGEPAPPSGPLAVVLALSVLSAQGCGLSVAQKLEKTYQAAKTASAVAEPACREICGRAAMSCINRGVKTADECPEWQLCAKIRRLISDAIKLAHIAVIEGMNLDALGDSAGAREKLAAAAKALADAWELIRKYQVLDVIKEPTPEVSTKPPPAKGIQIGEVL